MTNVEFEWICYGYVTSRQNHSVFDLAVFRLQVKPCKSDRLLSELEEAAQVLELQKLLTVYAVDAVDLHLNCICNKPEVIYTAFDRV